MIIAEIVQTAFDNAVANRGELEYVAHTRLTTNGNFPWRACAREVVACEFYEDLTDAQTHAFVDAFERLGNAYQDAL